MLLAHRTNSITMDSFREPGKNFRRIGFSSSADGTSLPLFFATKQNEQRYLEDTW
jgi:hypothetical protein